MASIEAETEIQTPERQINKDQGAANAANRDGKPMPPENIVRTPRDLEPSRWDSEYSVFQPVQRWDHNTNNHAKSSTNESLELFDLFVRLHMDKSVQ